MPKLTYDLLFIGGEFVASGSPVKLTLVSPVTLDEIVREEIFGPVASALSYRNEDEGVAIANVTDSGLHGSVFTADLDRGLRVAARTQARAAELNGSPSGYYAPMGRVKTSGIGRENGPEGLEAFLEHNSIGLSAAAAEVLVAEEDGLLYR